jgi:hypothetical protein
MRPDPFFGGGDFIGDVHDSGLVDWLIGLLVDLVD